jgi:uncharacterized protein (TIGR03083 family)
MCSRERYVQDACMSRVAGVLAAFEERCATLDDAWRWWAQVVSGLRDQDWERDTRLEDWTVAELVAHHSLLVPALGLVASNPVAEEPTVSSATDMLRRFNAPEGVAVTGAQVVADMARTHAESQSHAALAAVFVDGAHRTIAELKMAGPVVVDYFGNGTFPLCEAISIVTIEAVVHGLDLARALDVDEASLPSKAVTATRDLVASLPDPVTFIEAATGRTTTSVFPALR